MSMSKETIEKMIDGIGVSLISSVDESGFPNTKAMLPPRKRNGISEFYFTTNTSSMRVNQYKLNNKACIYFFDKRFFRGVMLIGTMEVLNDQKTKDMIWQDGDTMYYPQGVTDPDYCVLKFSAKRMRIYQNFKSENIDIA
ncbi:MAG: pyridoxamine 5'-phosphate oxidase [Spirochaetae bacterium HGW-Spirochaetae-1]|nr:MAG: pyridoxamine 5'-phosphate oxidase [Spirochaetae bacterium HGW-Spirochaetae-1]